MKFVILLSVLIFTAGINYSVILHHEFLDKEIDKRKQVQLELNAAKQKPEQKYMPYSFHYAGKEKFNNVYATYRFNKETGEILRYSYTHFEKKEDGTPQQEEASVINMQTGEQSSFTGSIDMYLLRRHWAKEAEKEREKEQQE